MNIEDIFFPDKNILTKNKNGTYCSLIVDAELDPLSLEFNYDDCVVIDTTDLNHICLTQQNFKEMIILINKSNKLYEKDFENNENHLNK